MNILLVVTGLPDNDNLARSVFNLNYALELANLGHNVNIIYLRALKPNRPLVKERKLNELKVFEVGCVIPIKYGKMLNFISHTIFRLSLIKKNLVSIFEETDVIHCINGNGAIYAKRLAKEYNKPYIVQFVGSDVNFDLSVNLLSAPYKSALAKARYLTFNSLRLKIDFCQKCKINTPTQVIYRGVKLCDFEYQLSPIKSEVKLLFLGGFPNMGNLKGGLTLLEALSRLDDRIDNEFSLVVSVGGPNSERNNFRKYFKNISIDYMGAKTREEVKVMMKESHIVVIPSLNEGLPNVLYEAMASGNLLICSQVGGIPEFIKHGKTGFLFPADDSEGLVVLLERVLNNPQIIQELAAAARNMIEKYDYVKFINAYLDIFEEIKD